METGDVKRTLPFRHGGSGCGHVSANRRFMVACNDDTGLVTAWEVDSGTRIWSSEEPGGTVATISPDGSQLVLGHADGRIERIDVKTEKRTPVTPPLADGLDNVTWSPDGTTFAGVTQERTVRVWDAGTREPVAVLRGHWGNLSQAAYSPDGEKVYAAAYDGSVIAWDLTGDQGIVTSALWAPEPGAEITAMAPDGSIAAVTHPDGRVAIFETTSREAYTVMAPEPPEHWRLAEGEDDLEANRAPDHISIDRLGRSLVLGQWEAVPGQVRMQVSTIDAQSREVVPISGELNVAGGSDAVVTWNNDEVLVAADRHVGLWDRATGAAQEAELFEAAGAVAGIGVHPGGRMAALS